MQESTGQDKLVTCVDCGAQFTFTARDQAFYQERGYQAPRRCKTCRDKRKSGALPTGGVRPQSGGNAIPSRGGHGGNGGNDWGGNHASNDNVGNSSGAPAREQFKVQCSGCGVETTVPFKPDPNRPVFCRTCYLNSKKK